MVSENILTSNLSKNMKTFQEFLPYLINILYYKNSIQGSD